MKYLNVYRDLNLGTEDEIFNYIIENLKPSNTLWSYFVDWGKVLGNTKKIEMGLNTLNYLIGKDNFDEEFKLLVRNHPEVVRILPSLVVRNGNNKKSFEILVDINNRKLVYENFDFTKKEHTDDDIEGYLDFVKNTGLKDIIVNKNIKNLVDYMVGIEAGLNSNARKNRSGHAMEHIVEEFVKYTCENSDCIYIKEANAKKIKEEWGIDVPVDKASRRYDFVINKNNKLFIIETNFYGGGGSKLSAIAGDYRDLQNTLDNRFTFIWITDGPGWKTASHSLYETFKNNDYLLTLSLLEKKALEDIINH